MKTTEIYWLAGLAEGEGCFSIRDQGYLTKRYPGVGIHIVMTDKQPIERAAQLLGSTIYEYKIKSGKTAYRANVYGQRAAEWMMTMYPLMSPRRQNKIRECLEVWRKAPTRKGPRERVIRL